MNRASNGRDACVATLSATGRHSTTAHRAPDIRMGDGPVALLLARPHRPMNQGRVELTTRNGLQPTGAPPAATAHPTARSQFQSIASALGALLHRRSAGHR